VNYLGMRGKMVLHTLNIMTSSLSAHSSADGPALYRGSKIVTSLNEDVHAHCKLIVVFLSVSFAISTLDCFTAQSSAQQNPSDAPDGMVMIPAGKFEMGGPTAELRLKIAELIPANEPCCDGLKNGFSDSEPKHSVQVNAFYMDKTEVTNKQYAEFVKATDYVTIAERPLDQEKFPGVPKDVLQPGSLVFLPPNVEVPGLTFFDWWTYVPGASWRHPHGPGSDLVGKEEFPVVHIAYDDANSYARWARKRLPTEAEWEWAARGGLESQAFPWGNELLVNGQWQCNAFQGRFPYVDSGKDGFKGVAPVGKYAPNAFGLYDMSGNVWEWCSDHYRPDEYRKRRSQGITSLNPRGPTSSFDPDEPNVAKRVHRGGSFLCSEEYCARYIVGTRGKGDVETGACHLGFRCVRDIE
jgi:formylglycine-generating enzyme